jgi:hypothetical protein
VELPSQIIDLVFELPDSTATSGWRSAGRRCRLGPRRLF